MGQPGYVYLLWSNDAMADGREVYKIGRTRYPASRHKAFGVCLPFTWRAIHWARVDDDTGTETFLHHFFAAQRLNGEWFQLSREDVDAFPALARYRVPPVGHPAFGRARWVMGGQYTVVYK
jgi:hypothetical protein